MAEDRREYRWLQAAGFPQAEADPIFHAVVRRTQQPFVVLFEDLTVQFANPAFYNHFQVSPKETEGRRIYDLGNRQWDIPQLRHLLEEVLRENHSVDRFRVEHEFEHLGPRYMFVDADRIEVAGEPDRILIAISDVTESEGNQEFQAKLIDAISEALLILDWDLRVVRANDAFSRLFGVTMQEAEGSLVYELGGGEFDIPELRRLLEAVLPNESSFDDFEVQRDFETIGKRTLLLTGRRLDHLQLILLVFSDVTDQRRLEEHRRVVIGELHHRVKNILANVSAIARQTSQRSSSVQEYSQAFQARISALARVHDMITGNGGVESARFGQIVSMELEAHGARAVHHFVMHGPDVDLDPRQAQGLIMAIHELASNALKHGALHHENGRIEINWDVTPRGKDSYLTITWRERGVPGFEFASPKGFGRTMIEENLPRMLEGSVAFEFCHDGIECRIGFPLAPTGQAMG